MMSNISVFLRLRPMLHYEYQQGLKQQSKIFFDLQSNQARIDLGERRQKTFQFNQIFSKKSLQKHIFEQINAPMLVERVLDGYHSTIFAYGQTGSGKTYTIDGDTAKQNEGLIQRSIYTIYQLLSKKNHNQKNYKIFLSYLQIYNEKIFDLIQADGKPLKMRWNKHQQFIVQNLFEVQCRDSEQALKWWHKGQKNKIIGSHKMNKSSSRSHCILTLKIISYQFEDPSNTIQSKLQIIDLAGSQRQKVTKSTGLVFKEGVQINKSLFTLRQVISSLYQSSIGQINQKYIPYRQSKLTSLLKQSIGGNTYCTMIACLNPTENHLQQSIQTLTYASMASFISNIPIKNVDPKIRQNQMLKQQNKQLKNQVTKLSQHIDYLINLMQNQTCIKCKNRQKNAQNGDFIDSRQPQGIMKKQKTPKNNEQNNFFYKSLKISNQNDNQKIVQTLNNNNLPPIQLKVQQKPKYISNNVKSSQQILQSINMIRDLIHANTGLRQKLQAYKIQSQKFQKQIYLLIKQNQLLRDRWDMVNDVIVPNDYDQPPILQYEKIIKDQKGQGIYLNSQHLQQKNSKISYNHFLSLKKKGQKQFSRKKKTIIHIRKVVNMIHISIEFL